MASLCLVQDVFVLSILAFFFFNYVLVRNAKKLLRNNSSKEDFHLLLLVFRLLPLNSNLRLFNLFDRELQACKRACFLPLHPHSVNEALRKLILCGWGPDPGFDFGCLHSGGVTIHPYLFLLDRKMF